MTRQFHDLIGQSKWALDTPALLVDLPTMERNVERMARTFRDRGVKWRPHTKALKIPALAWKLISAGAIGVTCAKLGEAYARNWSWDPAGQPSPGNPS